MDYTHLVCTFCVSDANHAAPIKLVMMMTIVYYKVVAYIVYCITKQ